MPDYPHFDDEESLDGWQPDPESDEVPASVTFMEMMRHAAAKAEPPSPESVHLPYEAAPVMSETSVVPERPDLAKSLSTDGRRQAALQEQRIRRVKKRRARRNRQTVGVLGGVIRSLLVVLVAAGLMATIFTWWTPAQFLNDNVKQELSIAQATGQVTSVPTIVPTPNWLKRIGIVSGHRGPQVPPDPGAVCPDGLTEASINFGVAQLVVRNLRQHGYSVDLLDEFDPRLDNYQAAALLSIHANTCQVWPGEVVSGYLIARAAARNSARGDDDVLVNCVSQYYAQTTGLQRREGVTVDMSDYHTFREINPLTPAAIIELGFLLADRDILTGQQDKLADGITNGILCFLEPSQLPPTSISATESAP